jgi:hypothetical protein
MLLAFTSGHFRPFPDLIDRLSRGVERSDPGGLQAIVMAWAAGANRRSGAEPRGEESFAFEPFQRCSNAPPFLRTGA